MRRKLSLHRADAMTIDMHRDPSFRQSAAYALLGSRKSELLLPSTSDRSRYTATRNLPCDSPVRGVETMEATYDPPPDPIPTQRRRRYRRTSKPTLFYTLYWEADFSERTELELIDESLDAIGASHLQTLIVGRSEYPKRSHVIVNVISPSTHRLGISPQPYFELLRWHLSPAKRCQCIRFTQSRDSSHHRRFPPQARPSSARSSTVFCRSNSRSPRLQHRFEDSPHGFGAPDHPRFTPPISSIPSMPKSTRSNRNRDASGARPLIRM